VNDGGETSFQEISDDLREELPLRLIDEDHLGPAHARNRGVEAAKGDLIAFTDDDCEVLPGWLAAFADGFEKTNVVSLGGQTQNPYPTSPAAVAWQDYLDFVCRFCADENDTPLLLPSNNSAYRRGPFEEVGGFDETFPLAAAEDYELGFRLVGRGFRQRLWPAARIWHHHPLTPSTYLKMQFRYGRGEVYLRRALKRYDHPKISKKRRKYYWRDLARHLRSRKAPTSTWALVLASHIVYPAGHWREAAHELGGRLSRRRSAEVRQGI